MVRRAIGCLALILIVGCGEPHSNGQPFAISEAGGLITVTVRDPDPPVVAVAEDAEVAIGTGVGDSDLLYRVAGGAILPNGSIVIANGGANEVRFYDPSGALLRTVGREGEGPGEFRGIFWMHAHSDGGVAVVERGTSRLTVLDGLGGISDVVNIGFEPPQPSTPQSLVSGTMVLAALSQRRVVAFPWIEAPLDGIPGPMSVAGPLRVFESDLDSFAEIGNETVATWHEGTESTDGPPIQMIWESPRLVSHGSLERWAYSDASAYRIEVYDGDRHVLSIEEERQRVPFSPDTLRPGTASAADSLPAYRDIRIDTQGRVWAESPVGISSDSTEWRLFDVEGTPLGILDAPPRSTVLDATGSKVLLLLRDALDVETVELRTVLWPAP